MVSGVLLTRYSANTAHWSIALAGLLQTVIGGAILMWAGIHYTELRGPLLDGADVVHPTATRIVGMSTVAFSAIALTLAIFEAGG